MADDHMIHKKKREINKLYIKKYIYVNEIGKKKITKITDLILYTVETIVNKDTLHTKG